MIIVITDNGNKYINENTIESVAHIRENRTVHVYSPHKKIPTYIYSDVQQVVYIGNNSDVTFKEDSNVVADLKKLLKEEEARYDEKNKYAQMLGAYARKLMSRNPELYDQIDDEVRKEYKDFLDERKKRVKQQNNG
jgi:hypothetical protein